MLLKWLLAKMAKNAMQKGGIFKVDNSFPFAVQIPDNLVGYAVSRCSNCNNKVTFYEHLCIHCKSPFVGPLGFPQFSTWKTWHLDKKKEIVQNIYCQPPKRGRLGQVGVNFFPLTLDELIKVENLDILSTEEFMRKYEMTTDEIRKKFLV